MQIPEGEFTFTLMPAVIFGKGSVRKLKEKVDELGAKRAVLMTVPPIATKTDFVDRIKSILGAKLVGVYSGVGQHVPRQCVIDGVRLAREKKADILITLGGSSVADEAVSLILAEARTPEEFFTRFDKGEFLIPGKLKATNYKKPKIPIIAIPTTLSGGEFRSALGITDTVRKIKETSYDEKVLAKAVILDPEMTIYTGKELWASTAMKSLADCFQGVCAPNHNPFTDAYALHAAQLINDYLLPSVAEPLDLHARSMLQHAAGMSLWAEGLVGGSIISALRHQIGGVYDVPHGIASTIVLIPAMNFNRPETDERLALVARAFGISGKSAAAAAEAALNRIKELIKKLNLPTRLRDVGVPREGIALIAEKAITDFSIATNPKPVSKEQLIGILEQAW